MADFVIPSGHYCEETLAAARDYVELLDAVSEARRRQTVGAPKGPEGCYTYPYRGGLADLSTADSTLNRHREILVNSLKERDGLADVYFADYDRFARCCVDAVNTACKGKPQLLAQYAVSENDFPQDYSIADYELAAEAVPKKDALIRVRESLPEAIRKTLTFAPEYLESGIAGCLAQNIVPNKMEGPKATQPAKAEKIHAEKLAKLRPHVATALRRLPANERTNPERIRDAMITGVVCSDWYLHELQIDPPYLSKKAVSVG